MTDRPARTKPVRRAYVVGGERYEIDLVVEGERLVGRVVGPDGAVPVDATAHRASSEEIALRWEGGRRLAAILRQGNAVHVALAGHVFVLEAAERGGDRAARPAADPHATSPMTGTVVKVSVEPGRAVAKGTPLFVVEAMKMEFVVKAPRDLVVGEVRTSVGAKVTLGEVVVTFLESA